MGMLLLSLRNVLRNRRRSLATIAAVAAGLTAVNLFGGYIANVYAGLQVQAVAGERLGHLTVMKKGMLLEGKIHPRRYMFSAEESARVSRIIQESGQVRLVSPRISVNGIASNGKVSTIFIGEGLVAEDAEILRGELAEGAGGRLIPGRSYGAALSSDLAALLGYAVGDTVTLLTSTLDGQANAMDAEIVDVFNTGNANTNDKYLLLPFSFTQNLLFTDRVERFVVLLEDEALTEPKRQQLLACLAAAGFEVEIHSWRELSSFYTQVKNLFDMIFGFIASIVFVIAAMSIANTMSNPLINDPRILHVRYKDFVGDPIATIRGYYEFTGRELTPQAEAAMRDYLANNKGDRHGKFEYSTKLLTDAGYDIDELNEEFRSFRERFDVPIEKRD